MPDAANDAVEMQTLEILKELDVPVDIDATGATLTVDTRAMERMAREICREAGRPEEYDAGKIRRAVAGGLVAGVLEPGDERTQQMVDAVRSNRVNLAREALYADYRDGNINRETFTRAKEILGEPVVDTVPDRNPFEV